MYRELDLTHPVLFKKVFFKAIMIIYLNNEERIRIGDPSFCHP